MLPFLPLLAVAAAAMGMLNALNRFFVPSLSPAMFNIATIACAIGLAPLMPRFGQPEILAIAIGTLLGGLGQILLQWPYLRREGFRYRPRLNFRDADLREVLRLMIPGVVGARRRADQRPRQYLPRQRRAARRRVLAGVRVQADVPADRSLRGLDRDCLAARHLASGRR